MASYSWLLFYDRTNTPETDLAPACTNSLPIDYPPSIRVFVYKGQTGYLVIIYADTCGRYSRITYSYLNPLAQLRRITQRASRVS
jgi:hypothetical protein